VHSTEKPFACPEPGCTYRAKLRKHIAAHLRTSVHAPQAPTTAAEPLCLPWLLPHVLQPLALDEQWSLQPDAQERQRTALFRQVLNNTARETFCETPTWYTELDLSWQPVHEDDDVARYFVDGMFA